jgi:hypothetical protein
MKDGLYVVKLTPQQVEEIHDFLNIEESIFDMEDYEIGEMVDNFIDDVLIRTM